MTFERLKKLITYGIVEETWILKRIDIFEKAGKLTQDEVFILKEMLVKQKEGTENEGTGDTGTL